jgi:hypothetical protein
VKLWVDNRLDNEVEISEQELASMFMESGWPELLDHYSLDNVVANFLAAIHVTWVSEDQSRSEFDSLGDLIWARVQVEG